MTSLKLYTKGARVWVKDPSRVWITATVTKDFDGKTLSYETEDLETAEIKISQDLDLPHLRNPDILIGVNDLTHLSYLHEPAVLHNLAVRFIQNQSIYTYCGIVLVAINPYEELPLYGNDTIAMYRGKNMGDLDPHIYAVAEEAFAKMERDNRDQSIIVSGESGAGKTVSAKYAMRYFATVGGTSQTETQIEKRVLASSPIMEAIGNAKTTRNDNSSRFGKYIEIDFNTSFQIIGANMRTYLLEKSRVVFQAADERNYHIFYQMCAARDLPELSTLCLKEPDEFYYLSQGENPVIDGVDDRSEFLSTQDAFRLLGFSDKEQKNIFRILAGILQLGNIVIDPGSGRADSETSHIPAEDESLKNLADLFQIKEEQMRKWLCNRKIVTVRESYDTPMNAKAAIFARDALAKCIYAYLFDWIVVQINKALRTSGKINKFIGVLDIYGFETFDINSFEQFCINYANEKLQQQFNQHVFKLEQEEYLREGIEWKMIDFYDNQPCIDLIESKLGVLDLLDEECKMPKGSDRSWVEKLYDKCKKWEHFSKPRLSQTAFVVKHFADNVEYESHGFLDKNRDTVMEEQIQILKASENDLLSDLFMEGSSDSGPTPAPRGGKSTPQAKKPQQGTVKQNKKTVGSQFRDSLNLLMQALNCTTPHYVRCIKPNDSKVAFEFDPKRAVQQLRACGVLETVRISAAGYPSRWTYYDFYIRYRVLCRSKDVARNDFRTTCTNIIAKLIKDEDKYQFGKNKLFFRAGQVAYLEKLRSERLRDCGVMIQKHVKGWLYRKRYQQILRSTLIIQKWARGFISRRRVRHLRRTKAAITLQTNIRGWVKRTQYRRNKNRTILLQARIRGYLARARHLELLRNSKAVIIQAHVRGWLQHRKYQRSLRRIVLVQSKIRQFLARRTFKKLKIEAKSIEHQKTLNKGLENKIISLQQRLTESERSLSELKKIREEHKLTVRQLEELKASETKNKGALSRVEVLEQELKQLKAVLEQERAEKVDLVNEKERESASFKALQEQLQTEMSSLRKELEATKEEANAKSQVNSEELLQRLESEKANIHTEYEQERIAYQKLLKAYNRLEVQYENLQDELRHARGEELMSNMSLGASMLSVDFHDEESAYGSNSGRSSVRSEKARTDLEPGEVDVALTIKMQQKLKEAQVAKDKLEKKVEELESSLLKHKTHQSNIADTLKLQEYEIENAKLKDDLKKLRESISDGYGKDSQIKEIMDQFEHMQDELERRQEECVQLRTVLANMDGQTSMSSFMSRIGELPEAEEIFTAYETQKNVIGQLREQVNEEKAVKKEMEFELRREIEELSRTCSEQQQLIHHAINKSPANNTEACLQHEIQRLTGENFDLREKIENLNENTKRLKRLLKTYMKKLTDVGASVPEIEHEITIPDNQPESMMPVIRKKESSFLGMFEYRKDQEQQILRSLIYDLKPKVAVQMLPGLPAYILFMMIRHTDYYNDDEAVKSLIQGAINMIKKVVKKKGMNDLDIKTLWLSNLLRILHNLKQYSGEKQFQSECTLKQMEQSLKHFDLSEYRRVLSDVAIWIYQGMTKLMEEEIQPILVPAILEHEGIGGIAGVEKPRPPPRHPSNSDDPMSPTAHVDPHEALDVMMKLLARFHSTLSKHGLDPEIISLIFKQIFYFICAGSLNNLLLRKDMCHWSRGMQIRYNIAQLEQWARDKKIQDEKTHVIDAFQPIIQAAQLLQARKSDDDVSTICDMCDRLKVSQIIKILNLYTPADEYEERVTPAFVRKIQAKLSARAIVENQEQATLLMDTKFSFAVTFPFNPSTIQLEELDIPEFYNNLHSLLKKT